MVAIETDYISRIRILDVKPPPNAEYSEYAQAPEILSVFREVVVFEPPSRPSRTEQRAAARKRHRLEQVNNIRLELSAIQRAQELGGYSQAQANEIRQPLIHGMKSLRK